jgi:DNA-binding response OmpR family regulator
VVDDTRDAAEALGMLLELEGYTVAVTFGGLQALHMLKTFRAQIAVLDLGMPGVDGYSLACQIRESQWGTSVHFIAFTGYTDDTSRVRATAAGFHQYVVKPIDPQRLFRLIANVELIE